MFLVPFKNNNCDVSLFGQEFDKLFAKSASYNFVPAVDIKEETGQYVINVDLPGIDPKNVDISVEGGYLTLSGEKTREVTEESAGYTKTERSVGKFERSFKLPETADVERISANGKHGVLTIVVPKKESVKPRKIDVQ